MRKILSLIASFLVLAGTSALAFGGGHKRGCDCAPACESPPPVPQEITPTVYVMQVLKRDITVLVEKRIPRELVTRECVATAPGCGAPEEQIVEKRCPVTEIVLVPQRQTVRFVTLVPVTTVELAVPVPVPDRPYCPLGHGGGCAD